MRKPKSWKYQLTKTKTETKTVLGFKYNFEQEKLGYLKCELKP